MTMTQDESRELSRDELIALLNKAQFVQSQLELQIGRLIGANTHMSFVVDSQAAQIDELRRELDAEQSVAE